MASSVSVIDLEDSSVLALVSSLAIHATVLKTIVSTKHPIKLYHRFEDIRINPFISRAAKKKNSCITMIPSNNNYTVWGDCAGNIFKAGEFSWQKSFDNQISRIIGGKAEINISTSVKGLSDWIEFKAMNFEAPKYLPAPTVVCSDKVYVYSDKVIVQISLMFER